MKRALSVAAVIVIAALLTGCASSPAAPQHTPLQTAQISYAQTAIAYEAAMLSIQDARAARLVNDAQWSRVEQAQKIVQQYAPLLRASLNVWESTAIKPETVDEVFAKIIGALAELAAVQNEVRR